MSVRAILRSETTAWVLGGLSLVGLSALAYSLIGWIGIGTIGLFGLVVSTNIALHGGHAVADSGFGSGNVPMYAKQLDEARKSQSSPEQKMAAAAVQANRSRVLYVINSVFIAMTALGFGLFIRHQL